VAAGKWYGFAPVRTRSSVLAASLGAVALTFVLVVPASARADVSSWLAIGGGATTQENRDTSHRDSAGSFTYTIGVGSSPLSSVVVGGVLRGQIFFGLGSDLGLSARVATGGFARGDWGLAFDAGVLWRPWRDGDYGEWPVQAVVTGGAPWGLQLALGADLFSVSGGTQAQGFFAALEIDLLRFTVTRQGPTETWWPNPAPAGGHPADGPPKQSASILSW
jgi:hypothetical protein